MLKIRIECKAEIERVFDCLAKLAENLEYKVWEYNKRIYLFLKVSSKVELEGILKKLKEISEIRILRLDYSLPWWKKLVREAII